MFWCHQDLQAIDLTTTFLFTVDQAHTWFSLHASFVIITPGRWTQFPLVFLFAFTCLKNTSWRSFFLPTSHYYPYVWTNLLKSMAISFKWGLWYVSERLLSHLLLSPHTSLSLISSLSANVLSHHFIEKINTIRKCTYPQHQIYQPTWISTRITWLMLSAPH